MIKYVLLFNVERKTVQRYCFFLIYAIEAVIFLLREVNMSAIIVVCIDVDRVDDEGFVILLFRPLLTLLHDDLERLFLSLRGIVVLAEEVFDHLAHTCLC